MVAGAQKLKGVCKLWKELLGNEHIECCTQWIGAVTYGSTLQLRSFTLQVCSTWIWLELSEAVPETIALFLGSKTMRILREIHKQQPTGNWHCWAAVYKNDSPVFAFRQSKCILMSHGLESWEVQNVWFVFGVSYYAIIQHFIRIKMDSTRFESHNGNCVFTASSPFV